MADLKEARVPDIGDYDDVPVIELLVAVGDTVAKDQGLVTLESDKATMEVPSPFAGVIKELKVKLGDSLSEGAVVAIIETADADAKAEDAAAKPADAPAQEPAPAAEAAKPAPAAPKAEAAPAPAEAPAPAKQASAPMGAGLPPVRFDADAVLPDLDSFRLS